MGQENITDLIIRGWVGGVGHVNIPQVPHSAVGGQGLLRQEGHRLVHIPIAQFEGPLDGPHIREPHVKQQGDVLILQVHYARIVVSFFLLNLGR